MYKEIIIRDEAINSYMLHNDCSKEEAEEHLRTIWAYFLKARYSRQRIQHREDNVILVTKGKEIIYYRLKGNKYFINKY